MSLTRKTLFGLPIQRDSDHPRPKVIPLPPAEPGAWLVACLVCGKANVTRDGVLSERCDCHGNGDLTPEDIARVAAERFCDLDEGNAKRPDVAEAAFWALGDSEDEQP